MFSIKGPLRSEPTRLYDLTWNDGELSGDDTAIVAVLVKADELDQTLVGPEEGPYSYTREQHLRVPTSALFVVGEAFAESAVVSGDIPERPAIPEGAVG